VSPAVGEQGVSERPYVTVIMPIRNEASFIARSVGGVLAQDYPAERMEVLVADGMSTDGTRDVIAHLAAAHPRVALTVVDNPGKTVPTGFNRALALARGDVIVRVDGHTIVALDYVSQCVAALHRSGADNVGGRVEHLGEGGVGRAIALARGSRFAGGSNYNYSNREAWVETVYLGTWPRRVFERIGGFDEEQVRNQDDEFNYRLLSRGGRILLVPHIATACYTRKRFGSLWRQYYEYGYWKVRVMQKHPGQMRPRQFVPPAFVAGLLISLLAAPLWTLGVWSLGLAAASYSAVNLAASWSSTRGERWGVRLLVPVAYAVLHVAWGTGFLVGLVRFAGRWKDRANRWPKGLAVQT
jgi:glycosyltransferase involved in cell wall biosynthesis